jgi:UDP-N-acetylmuramate--alanine ligase
MPMEGHATLMGPRSAHLVGVCGAGMKALAEMLDGLGWNLSGSDLQPASPAIEALALHGLTFHRGHAAANLLPQSEMLIYSPAIRPENPERLEAARRGLAQYSYGEMIGRLMAERTGIGIAGTHGKSTTTAMVGWILSVAGRDPAVLVGAELCDSGHSGRAGASDLFVVESCEFDASFLEFLPKHAAILNVEPDHFDCYADLREIVQAFHEFASRIPADGVLLVNGDSSTTRESVTGVAARIVTFGLKPDHDWVADQIEDQFDGAVFRICCRGADWGTARLRLHGEHNVLNALAAAALAAELGVNQAHILAALHSFGGVKRRFEVVGEWNGRTLVEDYAHHPTAVRATLQTARQVYGDRRILCFFQPHQVSRTVSLMDEFASSFSSANEVLIAPVFAARERVTDEPRRVAAELAGRIAAQGTAARFVDSLDQILATVDDATRPGDVLIAMGAGDIDRIHYELIRRVC